MRGCKSFNAGATDQFLLFGPFANGQRVDAVTIYGVGLVGSGVVSFSVYKFMSKPPLNAAGFADGDPVATGLRWSSDVLEGASFPCGTDQACSLRVAVEEKGSDHFRFLGVAIESTAIMLQGSCSIE